jgi:hypothetical protein
MMDKKSRKQLYDDKHFFDRDSTIPINALDLISELLLQEQLARDLQKAQEQTAFWMAKAQRLEYINLGVHYDIRS